ncbi:hypothetical protein HNQ54_001672 [Anaerocolumna cellulosilytica]|nr:hypothetical protein [Anaerocolumna cellulosilytica]
MGIMNQDNTLYLVVMKKNKIYIVVFLLDVLGKLCYYLFISFKEADRF